MDEEELAIEAAEALQAEWSIGESSVFCDEVDWDSASTEEIAEKLKPFLLRAFNTAATCSPSVVCLCGSSRWPEKHMEVMMAETLDGKIVIPMGLYGHADFPAGAKEATNDGDESTEVKQMLDRLHFAKIDLADEILVVNVGGYVGNSTRREIAYAEKHGKRVRFLEENAQGQSARKENENER